MVCVTIDARNRINDEREKGNTQIMVQNNNEQRDIAAMENAEHEETNPANQMKVTHGQLWIRTRSINVVVMVEEEDDLKLGRRLYITQIHKKRKEEKVSTNSRTKRPRTRNINTFIYKTFSNFTDQNRVRRVTAGLKRRHIQSQSVATTTVNEIARCD
jgi:hypothetical protein